MINHNGEWLTTVVLISGSYRGETKINVSRCALKEYATYFSIPSLGVVRNFRNYILDQLNSKCFCAYIACLVQPGTSRRAQHGESHTDAINCGVVKRYDHVLLPSTLSTPSFAIVGLRKSLSRTTRLFIPLSFVPPPSFSSSSLSLTLGKKTQDFLVLSLILRLPHLWYHLVLQILRDPCSLRVVLLMRLQFKLSSCSTRSTLSIGLGGLGRKLGTLQDVFFRPLTAIAAITSADIILGSLVISTNTR